MKKTKALVLFSGGQDSTTCLAWALENYDYVETVGFNYGQRHLIEMSVRKGITEKIKQNYPKWAPKIGQDHIVDLSFLKEISDTALTDEVAISINENGLPNTFVPGRNIFFLTAAASIAYRRGIETLVGGMCETDYSGYPDCRNHSIKSLELSLNLGMDTNLNIQTPLMWLNKKGTWELSKQLGGQFLVDLIVNDTHTCYLGDRSHLHVWGYGCASCPACDLRKSGYLTWLDHAL